MPFTPERWIVIDTETTGFDPGCDGVVSIAAVPVDVDRVRGDLAEQVLVNPGRPIPAAAAAVHGLTDASVADAPDLAAAMAAMAARFSDRVVVGHNLPFDLAFLAPAGFAPERTLDTLAASVLLWPQRGRRHRLDDVAARVGVLPSDRHTALGDALATAQALVQLLPALAARGYRTPEEVAAAYRARQARRARIKRSIRRRRSSPHRRPHRRCPSPPRR